MASLKWTEVQINELGLSWWEQEEIDGTSACAYREEGEGENLKWKAPKQGADRHKMHLTDVDTGKTWGKMLCTPATLNSTAAELRKLHQQGKLIQGAK